MVCKNSIFSSSDHGPLNTGGFLKNHLDTIFETHFLKGLLSFQCLLLVNLVEVFDFFASIVLLIEVFQIAFDLLLSLLNAELDLALLVLHLFLLLDLDLSEAYAVRDFIMVLHLLCTDLLSCLLLVFHCHSLVAVGQETVFFSFLLLLPDVKGLMLSTLRSQLDFLGSAPHLGFLDSDLVAEFPLSVHQCIDDVFFYFTFALRREVAPHLNQLSILLVTLEIVHQLLIVLLFLLLSDLLADPPLLLGLSYYIVGGLAGLFIALLLPLFFGSSAIID